MVDMMMFPGTMQVGTKHFLSSDAHIILICLVDIIPLVWSL